MKDDKKYRRKFKKSVNVDLSNINYELSKQPSLIASRGFDKADLEENKDKLDLQLEIIESGLYNSLKKKYKEEKMTEAHLKSKIAKHTKVIKLKEKIIYAKKLVNMSKTAFSAVIAKGEATINIAYNIRKEMEHNVVKQSREKRLKEKERELSNQ